ncbi:MAG: hypothetical protein A3D67_01445 [Candidatus Lloydbacteria bacterium RIFCSPHIGHO2_02_FULL_51_22]|nr:MAG: hypothetical protein A3D67_01445 [Candidatus Lloydbacteria bacterium RIFCSPHIGHO2_02_FULL_51_22]
MSNGTQLERLWRLQTKINMLVSDGKRDPMAVADIYQSILDGAAGRSWREEDGVIYFSVESDGTTGEDWITRLESKGFRVGDYAKQVLRSTDFKPTSGVTTETVVLPGSFFGDKDLDTAKIRDEAKKRKLVTPNAELACLIREKFRDDEIEAMGLWYIVAMHEPMSDSDGDPRLLDARRDVGGRWLSASYVRPGRRWHRDGGFAFAVSPQ